MQLRWLLIFITLTLSNSLFANEVLDKFLNELNTLNAQFEQKLFNEKGDLVESSQGQVYIQRPGKFRWDYKKPYNQLIIADGKKVWVYDQDLEQVTVKTLNKALGKTPALLLSSENKVEEDFIVTTLPPEGDTIRLELKPKAEHAQFEKMRLVLQETVLKSLELIDNLGQTTLIVFNQSQHNQALKPELFIFTPPKGTDVIEDKE